MHNLKEKLQVLELSDMQKNRIKQNIQQPAIQKNKKVPFVFAAAVALAIFFVGISLSPSSPATTVQGANPGGNLPFMASNVAWWSIANTVLVFYLIFLLKKCLSIVKRWQHVHLLQRLNGILYKTHNAIGISMLLAGLIWGGAIILPWPLLFAQGCFIVLFTVVFVLGPVKDTKDKHWTACPHCQVKMKRWHIIRKSTLPTNEKCASCGDKLFIHEKYYPFTILFIVPYMGFPLNTFFELSKVFSVLYMILSFTTLCLFFVPYVITFHKTEK